MDKVELKEFDTITLAGRVTTPLCISWSKDDKIALLTDNGVHVFELFPTPLSDQWTITFSRSWVPVSVEVPFQTGIVDNKANLFLWGLNRKEVYEVTIDSTLSSIVEKRNISAFIVECKFSPLIHNESYLSCLTNNGVLEIFKGDIRKWKPIINVTDLWKNYCKTEDSIQEVDYSNFKLKMLQLKIITMAWSESPRLLFITGHEDGGICIWNIDVFDKSFTLHVHHYFHIIGKPSCISMCEVKMNYFILVGTLLGTVWCVPCNMATDVALEKTANGSMLWKHEDLIKPSLITTEVFHGVKHVFTVKNYIVLIQKVEMDGEGGISILKTNWHEFPGPVVCFNHYIDNFIVVTRNHQFFTLRITKSGYLIEENFDLSLKPKTTSCFHCYGLAMSMNKSIWIAILSSKVNYDVKTMKDATQLILFIPKLKIFRSLTDITAIGLIKQLMVKYKSTKLSEISDLLELKRLELLAEPSNDLENKEVNDNTSSLELKLILWESKFRIYTQAAEIQELVERCETLLAVQWCTARRSQYMGNLLQLTEKQKLSLEIMEKFLKYKEGVVIKDECAVCGELTPVVDIRVASCSNSHTFPRCILSLLPCDNIPYAFCRKCDATAHLDFMPDSAYRCIFCDGLLVPDTRLTK